MVHLSDRDRSYILSGNYRLLDEFVAKANREIARSQKRWHAIYNHKDRKIKQLRQKLGLPV